MTAKNWDVFVEDAYSDTKTLTSLVALSRMSYLYPDATDFNVPLPESETQVLNDVLGNQEVTIESDHITEFSANVGLYLNLPLGKRFDLGCKFLIGRSMTQELDINSKVTGKVADIKYQMLIKDGVVDENNTSITGILPSGKDYETEWDYLTLGSNNSTNFGTGLSLTYHYKNNFSWRLFADYDYARKTYTLTYDPYRFLKTAVPNLVSFYESYGSSLDPDIFEKKKSNYFFTLGASFAVNF
jgi:hypothetical protein